MAEEGKALLPVEQKEIEFYGDELIAVRGDDGQVYAAIGQMCDALGIDRASQVRRIRSDEVLSDGYQGSVNLTYPDGGTQASGVLRVDLIPLWLTGLRLKAVREEIRPKLQRFKKEAARVLWQAFQEGRLTSVTSFEELLETDSPAVRAYKMALAIVDLARSQVLLESKLSDHEKRLEQIETVLGHPDRQITPAQASRISQAVKAVAMELSKTTGRNEYGGVYGELYRRYEIAAYRELPASQYDAAMAWLSDWYQQMTDSKIPF
jgi:hypothetical protein